MHAIDPRYMQYILTHTYKNGWKDTHTTNSTDLQVVKVRGKFSLHVPVFHIQLVGGRNLLFLSVQVINF